MPTLPSVPTSWLKRRQAGRCGCGQTAPAPRTTASTAAPPVLASRGKLSAEETLFGVLVELLEHRRHCAYCRDPLVEGEQAVYTHPYQKDNKGFIHLGGEPSRYHASHTQVLLFLAIPRITSYIPRPYTRTGGIEVLRKERFGELAEEHAPRGRVASGTHSRESHSIRLDQREARQHP